MDLPAGDTPGARGDDLVGVTPVMPLLFKYFTIPTPVLKEVVKGRHVEKIVHHRNKNGCVEGTLKTTQFQHLRHEQNHFPLDQVAQCPSNQALNTARNGIWDVGYFTKDVFRDV